MLKAGIKQERIDWAKRLYAWQLKNTESYDDDSLPHLYPLTGTEIFAEAFGCEVIYQENNMPFAMPLIFNSSAVSGLKTPKLEDTPLMLLFDIVDELRDFAGKDALVRLPDIQCPMDIAALIWEKSDFFPTMIDEPEAIFEISEKVKTLVTTFLDEWFKRYGTKYIAHYPNYYMENGITMSVDEIGCVSPQMFRTFFEGELNELSEKYGGIGIHSCAESINQWENIRNVKGLRLLNLHRNREQVYKALDYFKDTCAQMHYISEGQAITSWRNMTTDEIDDLISDRFRVALPLNARDIDHAKQLSELYEIYK